MLNITANKSSSILDQQNPLFLGSFEPGTVNNRGANSILRKTTGSGSNALLSLLSQDDFHKLKQEIHNHIDKIGGKIEEIAASDEEEDENGSSKRDPRPETADDENEGALDDEDDDNVILTSARGLRRPGTGAARKRSSRDNKNSANN